MHYTNHSSRLRLQDEAGPSRKPPTLLSFEPGPRGLRLCVRTVATLAKRGVAPKLAVAAAALIASVGFANHARAQLGYDPFAGNLSARAEERWASYGNKETNGTNTPTSTFLNGADLQLANANSFNFGVTAPDPSPAILTGGGTRGNIYSFSGVLTLTATSTFAPPAGGTFSTVVFSIRIAGNPLDTAGVLLTPNGGLGIAPTFSTLSTTGSGMSAVFQYAFQFDLSGVGGSNHFSISVPGSAASVSFGASQLDATTTAYGATAAIPEPSTTAAVAVGVALAGALVAVRRRRPTI